MALLYDDAELVPSKIELLRSWVPGRAWAGGSAVSGAGRSGCLPVRRPRGWGRHRDAPAAHRWRSRAPGATDVSRPTPGVGTGCARHDDAALGARTAMATDTEIGSKSVRAAIGVRAVERSPPCRFGLLSSGREVAAWPTPFAG